MQTTLKEQDSEFAARGATHYHDAFYPESGVRRNWPGHAGPKLFSRHYFNTGGLEIGLVIPDFFGVGGGVQVFENTREWGIPHTLVELHE